MICKRRSPFFPTSPHLRTSRKQQTILRDSSLTTRTEQIPPPPRYISSPCVQSEPLTTPIPSRSIPSPFRRPCLIASHIRTSTNSSPSRHVTPTRSFCRQRGASPSRLLHPLRRPLALSCSPRCHIRRPSTHRCPHSSCLRRRNGRNHRHTHCHSTQAR